MSVDKTTNEGMLSRMPLVLFLLTCIVASFAGCVVTFVVVALLDPQIEALAGRAAVPIGLLITLLGFIIPSVILQRVRSSRHRETRRSQAPRPAMSSDPLVMPKTEAASVAIANTGQQGETAERHLAQDVYGVNRANERSNNTRRSSRIEHENNQVRVIDWLFLSVPILVIGVVLFVIFDKGMIGIFVPVILISLWALIFELIGVVVADSRITYLVRLQIYGSYGFPVWTRTISLDHADEATADTLYHGGKAAFSKVRLIYITGDFGQAKLWFSTKGRRDWIFSLIRLHGPHVRQYRGRY